MKVLIVDGTYLLYRAFFTKSWDLSSEEEKTGGCYSVLRALHLALDSLLGISRVVVVWDGSRSERRKTLYPEYKGNRHDHSKDKIDYDDFNHQRELLDEAFSLLGVQSIRFMPREGDDVIFWLSRLAERAVILSDDKDMLLMLTSTVDVFRPAKEQYCTWVSFTEQYGYTPDFYIYEKAIVGDSSDNIKGVNGAGEKTARAFTQRVGRIGIADALQEAKGSNNARTRKIPEQVDIIQRNIEMMDCRYEPTDDEEIETLQRLLTEDVSLDKEGFQSFCYRHRFSSMISEGWLTPFIKCVGRVG